MRIFLNDLSLRDLPSAEVLRTVVLAILKARQSRRFARSFFCSRHTGNIVALAGEPLLNSVRHIPRDERTAFIGWLAKSGPFLDDERIETDDDDLYYLFDDDVTDFGPGEAARQRQRGNDARMFSFVHAPGSQYDVPVVAVVQGLPDEPLAEIPVPNFTSMDAARGAIEEAEEEPSNWSELLEVARDTYPNLKIGDYCDLVLAPLPFYPAVSRRALELLRVLQQIVLETNPRGPMSEAGMQLYQAHFVRKKAWFTDESDGNKIEFATEMTFPDPDDSKKSIQCFWHGKIKTPQFRIHFEWPMALGSKTLKVCYIGPKISKR
jgi:hypothetical protein